MTEQPLLIRCVIAVPEFFLHAVAKQSRRKRKPTKCDVTWANKDCSTHHDHQVFRAWRQDMIRTLLYNCLLPFYSQEAEGLRIRRKIFFRRRRPGYQSNGCFDFEIRFHWLLERLNLEPTHLWMDTSRMSDLLPESAVPILRSATTTTLTTFVIIHPNRHPFRSSTSSSSSTGVTTTTTTTTDRSPPPLKQTADVDRSRVDLVLKEKFGRKALCVALFSFSINLIHLGTIIVHHEIHIGSPTSC